MQGKAVSDLVAGKVVVVAIKASKEISKNALVWALNHVVQPGDCIKLLVVVPAQASGKKAWGFSRFTADCTTAHRKNLSGTMLDQRDDIADSCSQMMFQLREIYDPERVKIRVEVVSGSPGGVVASEAKNAQSNWVILDKHLKHEKRYCMEELRCNIVVMKRYGPKVLRLNLVGSPGIHEVPLSLPLDVDESSNELKSKCDKLDLKGPFVTPASSPEHELSLSTTEVGTSSLSSPDPGTSPFFLFRNSGNQKKEYTFVTEEDRSLCESDTDTDIDKPSPPSKKLYFQPWMDDILSSSGELTKDLLEGLQRSNDAALSSTYKILLESLSKLGQQPDIGALNYRIDLNLSRSVREAISLSENTPPDPPPLCSICQHKAPLLGNPPKWFTYAELELATDGFSPENFLAEGGFGSVYQGVLADGQVVAVKQHKLASSQGDLEFCSEVEVLSCAQHRNVVMLIGFCVEDARRLLVYEYICNGSLDSHLFSKVSHLSCMCSTNETSYHLWSPWFGKYAGCDRDPLEWSARQKIAVGAARGLRYLHEECRVGCIVHRDMRPNNILITHDFEPLVGDFGLARWQPDEDIEVETRIIGTFGYLAPEYAKSGQITEKADVYSFGMVLVELVTGRRAIDVNRPRGQQCLSEWARPLLEKQAIHELIDPRLGNCYSETQVHKMVQCASLCIQRDPHSRPRMSQVLRILEGDVIVNVTNQRK